MKKIKEAFALLCLAAIIIISFTYVTDKAKKGNEVVAEIPLMNTAAAASFSSDSTPFPIRNLTLDSFGKNIISNSPDQAGSLKEMSGTGTVIDTWKVEYEKKGQSRSVCVPPPLNIKFLKVKDKGEPKLFYGNSTYYSSGTLGYRKLRFIPECELWDGFFTNPFTDKLPNVSLREYMSFDLLRAFGVSTVDIVGFANVTFVSSDNNIDQSKTYRYLIVQRDNEDKDQIPFFSQFNLDPSSFMEAVGMGDYYSKVSANGGIKGDHLSYVGKNVNGVYKEIPLDPASTVRFFVLEDLIGAGDHYPFWNEDYAKDKTTGLYKIIPYSYDIALDYSAHDEDHLEDTIPKLPLEKQAEYKALYYKITREIFDNPETLNRIYLSLEKFPFAVDKTIVKNFMTLRFYNLALRFGSKEFSDEMGQTYVPYTHLDSYLESSKIALTLKGFSDAVDTMQKTSITKSTATYAKTTPSDTKIDAVKAVTKTVVPNVVSSLIPQVRKEAFCYRFSIDLQPGDKNNDVVALQEVLYMSGQGRDVSASGIYNDAYTQTLANRVKDFQSSKNINPTGIVGPVTRLALNNYFGCAQKDSGFIYALDVSNKIIRAGDEISFQWITYGISGVNRIELLPLNGKTSVVVFESSDSQSSIFGNSYVWKAPKTVASGAYKAKITAGKYSDITQVAFVVDTTGTFSTVTPSPTVSASPAVSKDDLITISSPALGAVLKKGDTVSVRWSASPSLVKVDAVVGIILKSEKVGLTTNSVQTNISNATLSAKAGSFAWSVPTNIADGSYYISIYSGSKEWRSGNFSIVPAAQKTATLKLVTPNGGVNTILFKESKYPIGWTAGTAGPVFIKLKNIDTGSVSAITDVSGIAGENVYQWLLPTTITQGKYKIQLWVKGQSVTESDNYFYISNAEPTITSIYPTSGPVGTTITVYGNHFAVGKNVFLFDCNNSGFNLNGTSADGKTVTVPLQTVYTAISGQSCIIAPDENFSGNFARFTVTQSIAAPSTNVYPSPTPTASPAAVAPFPDLRITGVTCTPTTITTTTNVYCSATVLNGSPTAVTKPFNISFQGISVAVPSIGSYEQKNSIVSNSFRISTPGTINVKFIVDPENIIAESDENNNSFSKDFTIQALSSLSPSPSPAAIREKQSVIATVLYSLGNYLDRILSQ